MATSVISVSIPFELAQFLEENQDISPSKILQMKLYEIKQNIDKSGSRIKALEIRNTKLREDLDAFISFAGTKGVSFKDMPVDKEAIYSE